MNRSSNPKLFGPFFVGLYGWLITIFFGMILVDILYSKLIPVPASVSSKVSDFLLGIGFVVVISAFFALAFAWKKAARYLVFISLCLILLEFLIPVFFSRLLQNPSGFAAGPWLRLIPGGTASVLALIGIYHYDR